jgi:hypothetical protein
MCPHACHVKWHKHWQAPYPLKSNDNPFKISKNNKCNPQIQMEMRKSLLLWSSHKNHNKNSNKNKPHSLAAQHSTICRRQNWVLTNTSQYKKNLAKLPPCTPPFHAHEQASIFFLFPNGVKFPTLVVLIPRNSLVQITCAFAFVWVKVFPKEIEN